MLPERADPDASVRLRSSPRHVVGPVPGLRAAETKGDFPRLTSVLVVEDSKTLAEAYFNGADPETLHDTRSATKSVTAALPW